MSRGGMVIFTGNSHPELARLITTRLCTELGKAEVYLQENKETTVNIDESVRGKDVFLIQTGSDDVNNAIMELLIMTYACKTSCAKSIVGVIPYLPYSKQSQMRKRGSIVAKLLATMLSKAGMNHIITMDLHHKEVQGFFDIPVDNLRASPFIVQYIQENIPDWRNAVIVARNPAAAKRATSFADRLRLGLAVIHGEHKETESEHIDGRHSPPTVRTVDGMQMLPGANLIRRQIIYHRSHVFILIIIIKIISLIILKSIVLFQDDMIDQAESFVAAAEILKERGAYKIYAMATHGLLSADAPKQIEESCIDEVIVTNTLHHELQKLQCSKIKTIDISQALAEAVRRIHHNESMSYLFRNISMDD
ncbi:LOW QUALITY PROTEIN: phosphoribosyl pyrophosphate synthase-associated protein 2-like [Anneissia japonica]|uniref:LOW QUALITY PROTEIN: phosphoribosyl pyrophosphate synthase-associated protein 2-like n=1 Tax=Anneissia japonica TaxID=1529436 RepID=UPI001425AB04|nr:LOW QUALITY PROTEIN: phosphoribosyl pyrophosphate synthase-associated protein 2-like [Anneissia japonica]